MQKSFCDRCGDEIPRDDGELTKFKVTIECEEEDHHGDLESTLEVEAELCGGCVGVVKKALVEVGLKVL
jgi:hypothetical protein